MPDTERLKSIPLFDGINPEDLGSMLKCIGAFYRSLPKGSYPMRDEEEIHSVGIVLSGQINMVKDDLSGNPTILVMIKPNELFGETFACGSSTASAGTRNAGIPL